MNQKRKEQWKHWHEMDQFQAIVEDILTIPEEEWDYDTVCQLARAYNNLENYDEAIEKLITVEAEGQSDSMWFYRLGYAYYYKGEPGIAKSLLEQTCLMDPYNEDGWLLLDWCLEELGEETTVPRPESIKKAESPEFYTPELYSESEMNVVENHIAAHFGLYSNVFHELVSPDIHVDIAVIEPTEERNYFTLCTMGMGAHRMNVPSELEDRGLDRAELLICLPPDWDLNSSDEASYWPIRWIKVLARLPGEQDTWLGWGHTVANGEPFAENTQLSGIMLLSPSGFGDEAAECKLPDGSDVNFYQMIPLYEEELEYKIANSADDLLDLFQNDLSFVLDLHRRNYCIKKSYLN